MATYAARGDRFEKNTIDTKAIKSNMGSASGRGRSPLVWENVDFLRLMNDPEYGYLYHDDFTGQFDATTACPWTITQVTSGIIVPLYTVAGGVVAFDSNGNASEADGINAQMKNFMVLPAAGDKVIFEARVSLTDVTHSWYVGLAGVKTDLVTTTLDDTVDKAGFYRVKASTDNKVSTVTSRTNADDATADVATLADGTFVKLGLVIDGLTSIKFYVNGVLVETGTTAANIPNAVMCPTIVAKCVGTSANAEVNVDWISVAQLI